MAQARSGDDTGLQDQFFVHMQLPYSSSQQTGNHAHHFNQKTFEKWLEGLDDTNMTLLVDSLTSNTRSYNRHQFNFNAIKETISLSHEDIALLNDYSITYLGGGNSRNFLVTNLTSGCKQVLKLENGTINPVGQTNHLKEKLAGTAYADVILETRVNKTVILPVLKWRVQCIDFCAGKDIYCIRESCQDDDATLRYAHILYSQMTDFLVEAIKHDTLHLDIKNSNWLLDDKSRLKIADTKAFIPITNGIINEEHFDKEGYWLVHTPSISPPEFYDLSGGYSADAASVFMLGKNMYEFLTNQRLHPDNEDATTFDFSAKIFQTPQGKIYEDIIRKAVKSDSKERITLSIVQQSLDKIKNMNPEQTTSFKRELILIKSDTDDNLKDPLSKSM
jgi:hypothetical protein